MKASLVGSVVASLVVAWGAMGCKVSPAMSLEDSAVAMPDTADVSSAGSLSGVDSEKPLNQLSAAEVDQLCRAIAPAAMEVASDPVQTRGSCMLRIIQTQFYRTLTTLEQCQQAMASCEATAGSMDQLNLPVLMPSLLAAGIACASGTLVIPSTCRATVGEMEGCLTAGRGAFGVANQATCETILSGAASRTVVLALGNAGVLACQGYQSKCPGGLIDMGDGGARD